MITLNLTRADDLEGVYLKLPSSPAEIGEAFAELDAISTDTSTTRITEVISNVYNLSGYIKNTDVEAPGALDKLSDLARKLQTMDRDSCLKFEGILDANSVNGIDDVLRLTGIMDEYAVLPDAHNGSSLGKCFVYNDVGDFPEKVRPYLNYQIIGEEFYSDHGGAFCRLGYVVRKDELPKQLLQAEQEQGSEWGVTLRLLVNGGRRATTDLRLPATEAALDKARQGLGIDEFAEADIVMIDYALPYLGQMIPQDCVSVEDLNELAHAIGQMRQTDGELLKYLSVLEVERPETFTKAYELALDLDDYERVPSDSEEYGRAALRRVGADDEIIDTIDGYMDFTALGEQWMQEDGVVKTEFGLVRHLSEPFEARERGGMRME
jgi:hypothetical protein